MLLSWPLVSVVVPTFNRYKLVQEAINSVLEQDYQPLELIVVDDGSEDETVAALRTHPRLRLFCQQHTGMPGQVRNAGTRLARGKYIAFLDSDDLWLPKKLSLQVSVALQAGHVISHTRERWLRSGRNISQRAQRYRRSGNIFAESLRKCVIGPSTVLVLRSLLKEIGGFREDLEIAEDYELWLRICARYAVGYIDQDLVIKRAGHRDQLSERYGQIEIFRLKALQDLLGQKHFSTSQRSEAGAELARKALIYANGCRKRGRQNEANQYETIARQWLTTL